MDQAAIGMEIAIRRATPAIVGHRDSGRKKLVVLDTFDRLDDDRDLFEAFQTMQETLLLVAIGVTHSDFMHFKDSKRCPLLHEQWESSFRWIKTRSWA